MSFSHETLAAAFRSAVHDVLSGQPTGKAMTRWDTHGPAPWFAWLLVCLMRQIPRQQWLVRIVDERLQRPREDSGDVPDLPGWQYEFHGMGCCLSGPGGELIDVDFHGDAGLAIDPYFFSSRLLRLEEPAFPEARLRALLPTPDILAVAMKQLVVAGVLLRPINEYNHVFQLADDLEACASAAAEADFGAEREKLRWALHLGDFEAARTLGGDVGDRAERAHEEHVNWLLRVVAGEDRPHAALEALSQILSRDEFVRICEKLFDVADIGPLTGTALECLERLEGTHGADAVARLLLRLSPDEHHPFTAAMAARYLLRRGIARERALEVVFAFGRVDQVKGYGGNPFRGELALLAIEFVPARALELVRKALRDEVPATRMVIAAALCVLDLPWCREELAAALAEKHGRGETVYLRAALLRSQSAEARAIAERWSEAHPPQPHEGMGYTWDEVEDASGDGFFESALEDAQQWAEEAKLVRS